MPQFAVLIYADDSAHAPDATAEDLEEPNAHGDDLARTGTMRIAYALTPRALARSVDHDGERSGPFLHEAPVVAGFYVLEAPDLDAALGWAGKQAKACGLPIEVRPVAWTG
jgi:hypothetical protein